MKDRGHPSFSPDGTTIAAKPSHNLEQFDLVLIHQSLTMSFEPQQKVFLVGATGETGKHILNALIGDGSFVS